jgi:hypothetical protein
VSARHQVNGRIETSSILEDRCGRRNGLSSFGAERSSFRGFTQGFRAAGRDLVLTCSPTPSFQLPGIAPAFLCPDIVGAYRFPATGTVAARPGDGLPVRYGRRNNAAGADTAMVIVVPNATVNRILRLQENACGTGTSLIPRQGARRARLHAVHREP